VGLDRGLGPWVSLGLGVGLGPGGSLPRLAGAGVGGAAIAWREAKPRRQADIPPRFPARFTCFKARQDNKASIDS